jgi:cysteinyl-tRNA synthetase
MARAIVAAVLVLVFGSCSSGSSDFPESEPSAPDESELSAVADSDDTPVVGDAAETSGESDLPAVGEIRHWLYLIDVDVEGDTIDEIVRSDHEMVVLDFIPSEANNTDYPMRDVIERLHGATTPKLVLAYIDIGQAEDFRTYWEPTWVPGDPEWIVGVDPDGWEGNYPVAFWWDDWRAIWLDDGGFVDEIVDIGFDGVYLDWVEAYSDENVRRAAAADGVDARAEMVWWVTDIAARGRASTPEFVVIAQNAAELVADDEYAAVIDGLAQEQVWFDGSADNDPPGDCPLPRTDADIETDAYVDSLSEGCRRQHDEFPDSTLHVSSEEYLVQLEVATARGLPVFTVDYALDPENADWVYQTSRSLGFVPFVSSRALDRFVPVAR